MTALDLSAIRARANDPFRTSMDGSAQDDEDRDHLLGIVDAQQAALEKLAAIAEAPDIITRHPKGDKTFYVEAQRIRAAIAGEGGA